MTEIQKNPTRHGKIIEFEFCAIRVAKWGSGANEPSKANLMKILEALQAIFSTVEGQKMFGLLTKETPLTILLNDKGENWGTRGTRLMAIDPNISIKFKDRLNGDKRTRFSVARLITHEAIHSILGKTDDTDIVVKMTDVIIEQIYGTRREEYSNAKL